MFVCFLDKVEDLRGNAVLLVEEHLVLGVVPVERELSYADIGASVR
jgi:hypothetical protein